MLKLKELQKINSIIDQYVYMDDEEAMKIRDKIFDLIQIQKAWDSNQHIKCEVV